VETECDAIVICTMCRKDEWIGVGFIGIDTCKEVYRYTHGKNTQIYMGHFWRWG
jgi:hypothetical protein